MASPVLKLLDFVDEVVSGGPKFRQNMTIIFTYLAFALTALGVWHLASDKDFSFLLTFSGCVQTLGFFMLLFKIKMQRSVAGISSKTLQVYVYVFVARLTSTLMMNGYLPVDRTGDWVYQASDIASLLLVFMILFHTHKTFKSTYQAELDTMPIYKVLPAFVLLAVNFHGNLNHSLFFDISWTVGLWFDTVAMLPQLWMLVMRGGEVEALTSNFVALIFASRVMAFWFWFSGLHELAPKDGGVNTVAFLIVGAHAVQVALSMDFMFHYFMFQCKPACGQKPIAMPSAMVLPPGMVDV